MSDKHCGTRVVTNLFYLVHEQCCRLGVQSSGTGTMLNSSSFVSVAGKTTPTFFTVCIYLYQESSRFMCTYFTF